MLVVMKNSIVDLSKFAKVYFEYNEIHGVLANGKVVNIYRGDPDEAEARFADLAQLMRDNHLALPQSFEDFNLYM